MMAVFPAPGVPVMMNLLMRRVSGLWVDPHEPGELELIAPILRAGPSQSRRRECLVRQRGHDDIDDGGIIRRNGEHVTKRRTIRSGRVQRNTALIAGSGFSKIIVDSEHGRANKNLDPHVGSAVGPTQLEWFAARDGCAG